jgi:hypothetical protein
VQPPPSIPLPITLATVGAFGTVVLVVGAVVARTLFAPANPTPLTANLGAASAPPAAGTASNPAAAVSSAAPDELADASPAALRRHFTKSVRIGQMAAAVADLERLLSVDPEAATDRELLDTIVDLTQRITQLDGPAPDRLFTLIAQKMGTAGGDLLYELLTTKGGSRAAKRAEDLLGDVTVRERASPAMRVAYDLRNAKRCDKIALFSRASSEGDGRTLGQLQLLNRSCRRGDDCCLYNDARLRVAMDAIKSRQR